jgi:hypothetical protein
MKRVLFLFFCCIAVFSSRSQTCTALSNGDWANAATWSCGHVPTCGEFVVIPSGKTVTITSQQNYSACSPTPAASMQIFISGCLKFVTGNKLQLPCGSNVIITASGSMVPGGGGGNSNYLEICTNIVWNAGDGTATGPTFFCANPPCNFLPIELREFTGTEQQKSIHLNWKTQSELNNSYFEIEKSTDGIYFQKINSIASKAPGGNSQVLLSYDYSDDNLEQSLYYYRLRQVDLNGTGKTSAPISVKIHGADMNIYPNPNSGNFSIVLPGVKDNEVLSVVIYNSIGQKVYESSQIILKDNSTRADITPSIPLPKGVYTTSVNFAGTTANIKLVVQ